MAFVSDEAVTTTVLDETGADGEAVTAIVLDETSADVLEVKAAAEVGVCTDPYGGEDCGLWWRRPKSTASASPCSVSACSISNICMPKQISYWLQSISNEWKYNETKAYMIKWVQDVPWNITYKNSMLYDVVQLNFKTEEEGY